MKLEIEDVRVLVGGQESAGGEDRFWHCRSIGHPLCQIPNIN